MVQEAENRIFIDSHQMEVFSRLCIYGKLAQAKLEIVIVLVVKYYNDVFSGFPIATPVSLLSRWPI